MKCADTVKTLGMEMIKSQIEFVDCLGVSFCTISRWKDGKFIPVFKTKRKLAPLFKKCGIEVDSLWNLLI